VNILLIEDDKLIRITLTDRMIKTGHSVVACATGEEGLKKAENGNLDVVITDLRLPGASGIEILKRSKELFPQREIILMTAFATVETAVEALRLGAYDYLVKPFSPDELIHSLEKIERYKKLLSENKKLKRKLNILQNREIIGTSEEIRKLIETIEIVGSQDFSVLITGESGTGKELAAKALHSSSLRAKEPFVAVNCAVIPEALLESELFGHEKGSFSGATRQHIGYFERADNGTLFIDDIDDIPLSVQVKLLRAIQERQIERVGGSGSIPINIRIVCASKVDLRKMVAQGDFRQDLFYRLNVVPLSIPPLRDRMADIPNLLRHFLEKHGADQQTLSKAESFLPQMESYLWPGNIRELENIVQRIIALPNVEDLQLISSDDIATSNPESFSLDEKGDIFSSDVEVLDYTNQMEKMSDRLIDGALEKAGGNVSKAAALLGIPRSTLRHKLKDRADN
jgi:DNA-binding NtrC family response regulator